MRVVDLFAGPGGWDVAANRLGFDPLGIEWDDAACATRRAAGFRTLQGDIAAMTPEDPAWQAQCDGLLASPPCQAFSAAGKRKGKDDLPNIRRCSIQLRHGRDHRADYDWSDERAALVVEPLRWALALRPEWTCWEQVPPVLPYWELCATLLESVGYWTWTGLLHAETFGVPQTRKRAILIASRLGPVGPPAATHSRYYPRSKERLDPGVRKWVSMAEALGWTEPGLVGFPRLTDGNGDVVELGGKQYRARDFRSTDEPAFNLTEKTRSWQFFRNNSSAHASRRRLTEPAPTLFFGHALNDVGWIEGRDDHVGRQGRKVTVEEAAVLQSFPVDFPWQGSRTKQFEQIGNAIPPGLAQPVLEAAMAAGELAAAA